MILCRLLFSDGGRLYARTQLLHRALVDQLTFWKHLPSVKFDAGYGVENVVHVEVMKGHG